LWLALLVLVAGCAPGLGAREAGPVVLRVGTGDSGPGLAPHEEIIRRFEEANPDVRVELESVGGSDYYDQLFAQIEGGSPPDLLQIGDDAVPRFVAAGALAPLDPFLDGDYPLDPGIYLPGVLSPGRWDGRQYLLPKDFSPLAVYYNKRVFDRFGVPYPKDGWGWAEFLETAQALTRDTDGDGATDVWGVQLPAAWPTGFEYWAAAGGGALVSPDGGAFAGHLDSPETTAALQFYADLYHRHRVAPPPVDLAAFGGGNTEFAEGRAAMRLFGRWPQADYRASDAIDLGVVGAPAGDRRANILLWSGFGISALSTHQEAAWRFLRFYVGAEGAQVWKDWALPTVKSVTASAGFDADPIEGAWIRELNYLTPRGYTRVPRWGDTAEPAIAAMLARAVTDPAADIPALARAAAAEAQQKLDALP